MEGVIGADSPLNYAEFRIIPSQNRYEARVCSDSAVEVLAPGVLEQLLQCIPKFHDLSLKGSVVDFKLHPPGNIGDAKWFTKSNLIRFLCIVASPDTLNITKAIGNEISQLEDSRKFHLSLYAKEHGNQFGAGGIDGDSASGTPKNLQAEVDTALSDASKNELLKAIELRVSALGEELASTFNQAAGATCSSQQISDLVRCSQFFGDEELRNSLSKLVQAIDLPGDEFPTMDSSIEIIGNIEGNPKITNAHSDTRVKYGVSPAKAAQVERQSSTESDESPYSSENDQQSGERSRTLIRSASPRRSASPMRRIQIGRSGSRRATALTIKSLGAFPARMSHRDATGSSSDEEGTRQPPRRVETNVQRISVQDAINLFERKQKDQAGDPQMRRSSLDTSVNANKSVLRRWSSGVGDNSAQCPPETVPGGSVKIARDPSEGEEIPKSSAEVKSESDFISGGHKSVETEVCETLDASEKNVSCSVDAEVDSPPEIEKDEDNVKVTASAEWTRQKEAELNQMLMKMMENKPVKYRGMAQVNNKSQNVSSEQKGGLYDHYKEKRDEKLRGETTRKRAEKEAQFKAMQQILDKRKAEMASPSVAADAGKKNSLGKTQKSNKSLSQSSSNKKETSKSAAAVTKKTSSKTSPLPAVRKSWPSTPSPRATGISPAKTPAAGTSSSGTPPTRRKPQATTPSVPRSSPKVERPQQRPNNVKAASHVSNTKVKGVNEKKQQPISKNGKTSKNKVQTNSGDQSSAVPAKSSFYNKMTKKSSVVPVESKPFLRKGSGIGPGVGSAVVKAKVASQPEESSTKSGSLNQSQENEIVVNASDMVGQQQEIDLEAEESHAHLELETGTQLNSSQNFDDLETSDQVTASGDDSFTKVAEYAVETASEEISMICPTAWVEIEEHRELSDSCDNNIHQVESPVKITAPVTMSSPRVRHSLSQMLLEETSEPDIVEWGHPENPPAMVHQKDAPKGLKRLLKFARKSRSDANSTGGWSSPSAFSEAEDEAEESKPSSKRNADNLLRKAALNAKNHGQHISSSREGQEKNLPIHELLSAQSNISRFTGQGTAHKFEDHISTSATATKASRSFFSLSAFKGSSKPNEPKPR